MRKYVCWKTILTALLVTTCEVHRALAQSDLQRQIDACGSLNICAITVPPGINIVNKPWNLRDKSYVAIRGVGTVIWLFEIDPAPVLCLDTTGTANIVIEGPIFALGSSSKRPDVLWLHGRGANSKTQNILSITNATFQGWYSKTTVALIAIENEEVHSTSFSNALPNTTALFLGRDNPLAVTSPFGPVHTNPTTMTSTNHAYYNCSFNHAGHVGLVVPATNDQGFGLTLGSGVHDLVIQGGSTSRASRGGVLHVMGQDNRRIAIIAPNWEAQDAGADIVIDGDVFGLSIRDGLLQANGPALRINGTATNVTLWPAEMLTHSILQFGVGGKLTGMGLIVGGFSGK